MYVFTFMCKGSIKLPLLKTQCRNQFVFNLGNQAADESFVFSLKSWRPNCLSTREIGAFPKMQNYSVKCKIYAKIVKVMINPPKSQARLLRRKTLLNSSLFQTVWVRLNLKKCSLSKTFGDVWGLEHICKHSWQPRRARRGEKRTPIGTVDSWFQSDWFTYWVTWLCRESGGGQASGVSVRGQGSNQGRTLCADTYESCSDSRTRLPFPSPQPILIIWRHEEDGNALRCERALQHEDREERRPLGRFWDAVLSQMGLQGWGRWM